MRWWRSTSFITGQERREYYERKLAVALDNRHNVNASVVAEVGASWSAS